MSNEFFNMPSYSLKIPEPIYMGSNRDVEHQIIKSRQENEKYQNEIIRILSSIESNTANLYSLVDLVSKSNEQQDELIAIFADVMSIAKASNKDEAKSLYGQTIGKITKVVKDAEALAKLLPFATTVFEAVKVTFENIQG